MSLHQLNSKNNGLVLLLKTLCFLSYFATDGKDGNEWKLEKTEPIFQALMLHFQKAFILKKY